MLGSLILFLYTCNMKERNWERISCTPSRSQIHSALILLSLPLERWDCRRTYTIMLDWPTEDSSSGLPVCWADTLPNSTAHPVPAELSLKELNLHCDSASLVSPLWGFTLQALLCVRVKWRQSRSLLEGNSASTGSCISKCLPWAGTN